MLSTATVLKQGEFHDRIKSEGVVTIFHGLTKQRYNLMLKNGSWNR
jgi:hypothetical protein